MIRKCKTSNIRAPSYHEEAELQSKGYSLIAGVDEVGRGTLAGPVLAGSVVLRANPKGEWTKYIRDSKQLSPKQREYAMTYILKNALGVGTGISTSKEIDELGIAEATRLAMTRAICQMQITPDFLLLDAFPLPEVNIPQKPIIKGDSKCLSIAAASVIAKVTRDKMMTDYDLIYPGYGFAKHKGYGTLEHKYKLQALGPCTIHRFSFSPIKQPSKD